MNEETRHVMRFTSTLIGCFFMMIPCGVAWYWGNMSVYVYSYSLYHHNADTHEVKAPWLLSVYIITWSCAMLAFGQVSKFLKRRLIMVLAILSFNGGFASSYLVLDYSISWMDFTLGILCGLGNGFLFAMVLQTVVEWTERRVGLVTSAVVVGVSVGSVLINQMATHYINPKNLKVDTTIGRTRYFSQKEILDKVPSLFLILMVLGLSCQVIGFCLIRKSPLEDHSDIDNVNINSDIKEIKSDPNNSDKDSPEEDRDDCNNRNQMNCSQAPIEVNDVTTLAGQQEARTKSDNSDNADRGKSGKSMSLSVQDVPDHTHSLLKNQEDHEDNNTNSSRPMLVTSSNQREVQRPRIRTISMLESNIQLCDWEIVPLSTYLQRQEYKVTKSPSQVLRSRSFYILWVMLASVDCGYMLLCNYYKAFGQLSIKNDHFLTNLGTGLSVVNIIMRITWGIVIDNINIKTSLVGFNAAFSLINSFYYFTPLVDKWFFFSWSMLSGCLISGVYINFAAIVRRLYGKEHFNTNFGLLFTATIATNLAIPTAFRFILMYWGWFAIFMSTSSLCFLSLLLVVCFLDPKREIPQ